MRIAVAHTTVYRYDVPVYLEPHVFRLRPREDGAMRLLGHELRVEPAPAGSAYCLDQDGNVVLNAWFDKPAAALEVHNRFEVETLRENPFDFVIADAALLALPIEYPVQLRATLVAYAQPTRAGRVADLARSVAQDVQWQTLAFLTALNQRLYHGLRHIVRDQGDPLPPAATLDAGEGSCRDLAELFSDACRSVGLAARFVSGYEEGAANQERADMHAWSEVYLPGGGWRGFDPSRGLAVASAHVPVAAARYPALAAPISGAYRGSAGSRMEVSVRMTLDSDRPAG
jgi:transglutaminase-like putative cysteine protease